MRFTQPLKQTLCPIFRYDKMTKYSFSKKTDINSHTSSNAIFLLVYNTKKLCSSRVIVVLGKNGNSEKNWYQLIINTLVIFLKPLLQNIKFEA